MKLYADEPGHREIRALQLLVVSAITRVEVPSALWRKARTSELEDSAASILVTAFELDFHGDPDSEPRFTIASLTEPVLIAAAREAARHALRAYDAVQLASALAVRETDLRCSHFACFDADLRRAASRESFTLVPETVCPAQPGEIRSGLLPLCRRCTSSRTPSVGARFHPLH